MKSIPRLHVITDESLQPRFSHGELARLALAGGADCVQFREKRPMTTIELARCARPVVEACRAADAMYALGGIGPVQAGECLAAGAHGIAVLSGVGGCSMKASPNW